MKKQIAIIAVLAMLLSLFVVPVYAAVPGELITNGDFESGNTDFYSDYTYVAQVDGVQNELYPPFVYGVGTNPNDYHSSWASFGDNTSGSGMMMIVNASNTDPTKIVWGQNVTLPECTPTAIESRFPLYAGQTILVGEVLVKSENEQVCVKFVLNADAISAGWLITETHVAVADAAEGIPQKNGNPIPGKFPEGEELDPGMTEAGWYCLEIESEWTAPLAIAAHAVVEKEVLVTPYASGIEIFVSDTDTDVTAGNVPGAIYPTPAVFMTPGTYNPNTWINATGSDSWTGGPIWIWEQNPVVNPILGDVVYFEKTFNMPGIPTAGGELKIATDNGYAVWLNGNFIGSDNLNQFTGADDTYPVYGDAMLGDLMEYYVPWTTWQEVGIFTLPVEDLQPGTNVLKILAANEYMNTDDVSNPVGTTGNNPGGVVFSGSVDWERPAVYETESESAWGGVCEFPGKNWARYICYTPEFEECSTDYEFSFFVANSYPTNLAHLEVLVNGESIGTADLSEITEPITGQWKQFKFPWINSGEVSAADIVIKDLEAIYDGDDFCIDDISFVIQ